MTYPSRRGFARWLVALGGVLAAGKSSAHHVDSHLDDQSAHRIVYQCNHADTEYLQHILFSVGELIRKYGDDVEIVVACFGPGIHLLGRRPGRPVPSLLQARARSLSVYGVSFHACGNTLTELGWQQEDLLPFAKFVPVGVEDIMLLQEAGFAYMAW